MAKEPTIKQLQRRYKELLSRKPEFYLRPDYTINDFAEDLGTNRTYASRFSNQVYGVHFCILLQDLRLNRLMKLMKKNPDRSATRVALSIGFTCAISFRRAFVRRYGYLPTEYPWKGEEKEK